MSKDLVTLYRVWDDQIHLGTFHFVQGPTLRQSYYERSNAWGTVEVVYHEHCAHTEHGKFKDSARLERGWYKDVNEAMADAVEKAENRVEACVERLREARERLVTVKGIDPSAPAFEVGSSAKGKNLVTLYCVRADRLRADTFNYVQQDGLYAESYYERTFDGMRDRLYCRPLGRIEYNWFTDAGVAIADARKSAEERVDTCEELVEKAQARLIAVRGLKA